jgi:hypothetical protein
LLDGPSRLRGSQSRAVRATSQPRVRLLLRISITQMRHRGTSHLGRPVPGPVARVVRGRCAGLLGLESGHEGGPSGSVSAYHSAGTARDGGGDSDGNWTNPRAPTSRSQTSQLSAGGAQGADILVTWRSRDEGSYASAGESGRIEPSRSRFNTLMYFVQRAGDRRADARVHSALRRLVDRRDRERIDGAVVSGLRFAGLDG